MRAAGLRVIVTFITVASLRAQAEVGDLPSRFPEAERVVAIGDLHGDLDVTRRALALAGVIDGSDRWIGGKTVVVQLGDQTDRGDDELDILELLDRLTTEAKAAGGAVHALNGNHELMNADGDFRYVTPDGMRDSCARMETTSSPCDPTSARRTLFQPGGAMARLLARRNTVIIVGRTLFVHGGVRPDWARYGIEQVNQEARSWLTGTGPRPAFLDADQGPVWSRAYSEPDKPDCSDLEQVLKILDIDRMVVAHTVQEGGITSRCDERVWRIDVGLSRHYGGPLEILELTAGKTRVLGR